MRRGLIESARGFFSAIQIEARAEVAKDVQSPGPAGQSHKRVLVRNERALFDSDRRACQRSKHCVRNAGPPWWRRCDSFETSRVGVASRRPIANPPANQ